MIKKVLLIIGMHRSGTSALAGMMSAAGLDVGRSIMSAKADNPLGFYENQQVVQFNNDLLEAGNASWDCPYYLSGIDIDSKTGKLFADRLSNLLKEEYDGEQIIIKDPRISLLLPFYLSYLNQNEIETRVLICLRPPAEIAASLNVRHQIGETQATLLWIDYIVAAEWASRESHRIFVEYDELLVNSKLVFNRVKKSTGLSISYPIDTGLKEVMKHHTDSTTLTFSPKIYHNESTELYENLKSLRRSDTKKRRLELDRSLDVWFGSFRSLFEPDVLPVFKLAKWARFSKFVVDNGNGYNQWNEIHVSLYNQSPNISFEVDLSRFQQLRNIKWFPILSKEYVIFKPQIEVVYKDEVPQIVPIEKFTGNFIVEDGELLFLTREDYVEFNVVGRISKIIISAEWRIFNTHEIKLLDTKHISSSKQLANVEFTEMMAVKEQKIANLESQLSALDKPKENLELANAEIERLRELQNKKNEQLKIIVEERDSLKAFLLNKEDEINKTKDDVALLQWEYSEKLGSVMSYRDEIIDREMKCDEDFNELNESHQTQQQINERLTEKLDFQLRTNNSLKDDIQSLNVVLSKQGEIAGQVPHLHDEIERLRQDLNGTTINIEELAAQLNNKSQELEDQIDQVSELNKLKHEGEDALTDSIQKLELLKAKYSKKRKRLQGQNEDLQNRRLEDKDLIVKQKSVIKESKKQVSEIFKLNEKHVKKLESLKKVKSELSRVKETVKMQKEELTESLESNNQEIDRLHSLNELLTEEKFSRETEIMDMQQMATLNQSKLVELADEIQMHVELITAVQLKAIKIESKYEKLKKQNKQLTVDNQGLNQKVDEKELMDVSIAEINVINNDLESIATEGYQNRISEQNGIIEDLQAKIDSAISKLNEREERLLETTTTLAQIIKGHEIELLEGLEPAEIVNRYIVAQRRELEVLRAQIEGTLMEAADLMAEKNALNEDVHTVKQEIEERINIETTMQKQLDRRLKELRSMEIMAQNANVSLEAKKSLIQDLKNDLLKKQEDLLNSAMERRKYDRVSKAAQYQMKALKASLSYRLGFGITSPLRLFYDKVSNKPFKQSGIGKVLVSDSILDSKEVIEIQENKFLSRTANLLPEVNDLVNHAYYNVDEVDFEVSRVDIEINIDESKLATLLFISPNLPDYDESSGGRRATRMLELLVKEYNVIVFTLGDRPKKYIDKLESLGVNVSQTSRIDRLLPVMPVIDVIIYAWYYTYFDAYQFRDIFPDALIIVDTVDVHWVRELRSLGLLEGLTLEKANENKAREILAYKGAAIVWTVSEEDRQEVLLEIPNADIRVVSNIHDMMENEYVEPAMKNILFIGGFRHYPNISAVKILAMEIMPSVQAKIPETKLLIAGSHAPKEVVELGALGHTEYLGFIEDEDLTALYKKTYLIAAPLIAGAGIKGKICESIVHRTPVVTNAIGNEGINLVHKQEGFIAEGAENMAKTIVAAFQGEFNLDAMTERAAEKLLKIVGPDVVEQRMSRSIYPEISICIVTWNRLELLKRCIDSVLEHTKYPKFRVLVHSNGCEDGTQEYLKEMARQDGRIEPILSDTNDVFVIPNNQMMAAYLENDVVLLNNDTEVTENWLSALHQIAYSDPSIGISGSKLLYPDGTLQEFGSELYADGTGRNIGKWDDPSKPEFNEVKEVGYVSGCSLYLKRATLDKTGYFDPDFHPCYCEDSDLCYTAKELGLKTVVTPKSVIYHFEGGTSGTDTSTGFKSYQEINMKKFLAKHKDKPNGINWTK